MSNIQSTDELLKSIQDECSLRDDINYTELANIIEDNLDEYGFSEGDQIPSGNLIAIASGAGYWKVKQALKKLINQGVIRKEERGPQGFPVHYMTDYFEKLEEIERLEEEGDKFDDLAENYPPNDEDWRKEHIDYDITEEIDDRLYECIDMCLKQRIPIEKVRNRFEQIIKNYKNLLN